MTGSRGLGNSSPSQPGPLAGAGDLLRGLLGKVPRPNVTLSVFQTFVGVTAGIISILGALFAIPSYFKPAPGKGQIVAIILEAKTEKAVSDATVEILTPNNAVVTTFNSNYFGKASYPLEEGLYRLRVSDPKFAPEVRHVQVASGQSAEVRVRLHSGASVPLRQAERLIDEGVSAVKRVFGR